MLPLCRHIGDQNGHTVNGLVREGALCGNFLAADFHDGQVGEYFQGAEQDLSGIQVCGEHGEQVVDQGSQFRDPDIPEAGNICSRN